METVPPSRAVFKGDFIQPGQNPVAYPPEPGDYFSSRIVGVKVSPTKSPSDRFCGTDGRALKGRTEQPPLRQGDQDPIFGMVIARSFPSPSYWSPS
jgi:hypothetical protein